MLSYMIEEEKVGKEEKVEEKEVKKKETMSSSSSSSSITSNKDEKEGNIPKVKTETENKPMLTVLDNYLKYEAETNQNKKQGNDELKYKFSNKIKNLFKKPKEEEPENPLVKDENRTLEEIITSKNYKCEKHLVKTEDGYTLVLFRIPGGKNCEDGSKLPPVLLQHGIFDSSDGWVSNGEDQSIAFVLAKHNFDVWLGNSRGNKYCKTHDKFDEKSYEFWQFSFHEMGLYDIPAVIKYIREINKSGEKVIYFGHSQGTSLMFSGLAQKFDFYKENLKLFVALAPVARLSNLSSHILNFLSNISIHKMIKKTKVYEMCPNTKGTQKLMNFMENHAAGLTNFFLGLISDSKSKEYNDQNSLAVYFKHYPCGSSLKGLIHFVQIIKAKKFVYYDYQKEANCALYRQKEPPEYDLSVVKDFPIMLIGGEKDRLASPNDVVWLKEVLKENVIYYKIMPKMGHISFMCGKDFTWFDDPLNIILNEFYQCNKELKKDDV